MTYQTWAQIEAKVRRDLGMTDEILIDSTEMMGYANDAIDECEALIHTKNEDYFLTYASIALVSGTSEYALPTDIYAQKIREIIYQNGSEIYEITRIRGEKRFLRAQDIATNGTSEDYQYLLVNVSASAGVKLKIYPTSRETSSTNVTMWYLRNATRMTLSSSICDIPEFIPYITQSMKVKAYEKEGNPKYDRAVMTLDKMREVMETALSERVVDDDNTIPLDLSAYDEMS
jgi:hypothetical protein